MTSELKKYLLYRNRISNYVLHYSPIELKDGISYTIVVNAKSGIGLMNEVSTRGNSNTYIVTKANK